jgi:dipeptidyl-peptidase 4
MPSLRKHSSLLAVAIVALPIALPSQQFTGKTLTLEQVVDASDFYPAFFGPARWLEDEAAYTTLEPSRDVQRGSDLVRYDAASGQRSVLVPASRLIPAGAQQPLRIDSYRFSSDKQRVLIFTNTARVWRNNTRGDYWLLDRRTWALHKLGGPDAKPSTLMFAKISPDGKSVGYVRENDLYVEPVGGGSIRRLTSDGSRTTINGTTDWVYEEELFLRDAFRWSPDSKAIAYWQFDVRGVRDFLLINDTDSLYSFTIPVQYPKAGTTNSAVKVGVVSADGGETRWLRIDGDPRQNYIARMEWAANPTEVLIQRLNRAQNALELIVGDAKTGATRTIFVDRDSAYVDVVNDDIEWLDGGRSFTWLSDRDGWRHLYLMPREGGEPKLITHGDFDVVDVAQIDTKGGWVYFHASPDDATRMSLYRTRLDGTGKAERLTPAAMTGSNHYAVSSTGAFAFLTHTRFDEPQTTSLVALPTHSTVRGLASNATAQKNLGALARGKYEFTRVDAGGVTLDAWLMFPPTFDPSKRYPVLFHVYGEPAGQTVTDEFGYTTYLWHLMLTQRGYIVASIENRGTPAPRGRAFRKALYKQIGVLSSRDQASAARALLRARPYLDSTRVGIWGWSGGGSMTLNLMFRSSDLYRVGMSVAPVPDMHLYDTIYQERYMGVPQDNESAYREGSPLTFVDGLKGDLLVVHGSGDDNVHYQGTERLVNALVAANKQFQLMVYPNRTHGIFEGPGTQLHLYSLLTKYLTDHLAAGPR